MSRAIILVLAICVRLSADDQWPEFLGPSHNNHAASATLPTRWSETENVKWKTALPGEGWSSPVVWDEQIWLTTSTSEGRSLRALCVNKTNGMRPAKYTGAQMRGGNGVADREFQIRCGVE